MELGLFLQPATKPGRPLADIIEWNVEVISEADKLGFHEVWIGQHITSPWEPLPSPQQIIARSVGETSKIRLGTGVEVLYQSHPVRLAAELAQLDQMARGRLMFGFGGGGTPTDAQLYNVDFSTGQHQEMSREALKIILDCWKPGGPDEFNGKYWSVKKPKYSKNYNWHLEPFKPVKQRIGFAGFMPDSSSLKIAGKEGYIPLSFNVSPENVAIHWPVINNAANSVGKTANREQWRHIREIYVADSNKEARNAVLNGFAAEFWNSYFKIIIERLQIEHLFRRPSDTQESQIDAKYLVDSETWFVGDPDTVISQIVNQYRLTGGFGVLLQMGFDYSEPEAKEGWLRSMNLLSNEVMPKVNAILNK